MDSTRIAAGVLSAAILILAPVAASIGIFHQTNGHSFEFFSVRGETVAIQGRGLYACDSVSMAAQAVAQDIVTLAVGIPLLALALYSFWRRSLRGELLLAGTLGYFLYTYASYALLACYNRLFLLYVALFSASLFAFILVFRVIDLQGLLSGISAGYPRKSAAGFLFAVNLLLVFLWLERILPSLLGDVVPFGLEHYSTLVIQAFDLGVVVPAGLLAGVLLWRRRPWGYLLASVLIVKGTALLAAISAMIVSERRAGVPVETVAAVAFPLLGLAAAGLTVHLFRNVAGNASVGSDGRS